MVANELRHRQFVKLFGAVSGSYLNHDLGHLRIGTTASDTGRRDVEDFVPIADLAAGAVCDTLNAYGQEQMKLLKGAIAPLPATVRRTTRQRMTWWANRSSPLKRLTLSIEPGSTPRKILVGKIEFPTMPLLF